MFCCWGGGLSHVPSYAGNGSILSVFQTQVHVDYQSIIYTGIQRTLTRAEWGNKILYSSQGVDSGGDTQ